MASLWRGNTANVIRYFPTQALNFAFKDFFKSLFKVPKSDPYLKQLGANLASGGAAGASSLFFVYSLDYARTRLANDAKSAAKGGGERQFNGLVDVYRKTIASDGIAGLYRGFVPSVIGIIVYRGLYFGMYDSLKPVLLTGSLSNNFLASFLLGWGVTTGAGLASYPLDTIRRRMMMTSGTGVNYNGILDAGRQIVAAEGVKSLFKGAGANILRGIAGAGVLSGVSTIRRGVVVEDVSKAMAVTWEGSTWQNRRSARSAPRVLLFPPARLSASRPPSRPREHFADHRTTSLTVRQAPGAHVWYRLQGRLGISALLENAAGRFSAFAKMVDLDGRPCLVPSHRSPFQPFCPSLSPSNPSLSLSKLNIIVGSNIA